MEEAYRDELKFYSKFARPLIFNLPEQKDRVLASGWVKKIRNEEAGTEKLRTDYLKLLLFALQRQKLVGIFADDPERYEKLEEFPAEFDLNDMARNLIEKEQFERVDRIRRQLRGQVGDFPPYTTDCSSDFREYVAAQDIPGFGVHCYYAISKEPVNAWRKADKGIFPKMAKSAVDATSPIPPGVAGRSSDPSCVCPPAEGLDESECKKREPGRSAEKKKRPPKKLGKTPPAHPLGKVAPPEEREAPTWSSNLMEVRDMAQEGDAVETEPEAKAAPSTGAIPKVRTEKQKQRAAKKMAKDMEIEEIEEAMKEYEKGEIGGRRKKRIPAPGKKRKAKAAPTEATVAPSQEVIAVEGARVEAVDDVVTSEAARREEEIKEDSRIIDFFKEKLIQSGKKDKLAEVGEQVKSSSPAAIGIPLTTPRSSPSPKRQKSSEKLYASEEVPKAPPKRQIPKRGGKIPTRKDSEMQRMFEEATEMVAQEEQANREFEELERELQIDVAPDQGTIDDKAEYDKLLAQEEEAARRAEQQQKELAELPPMFPLRRGSPEANAILSDYMGAVQPGAPRREGEAPPTPPMFSSDPAIRKAAEGRVFLPEDLGMYDLDWQHGPEFFEKQQEEFEPFDPRQQPPAEELFPQMEQQYADQIFFDMQGEPNIFDDIENIDQLDISYENQFDQIGGSGPGIMEELPYYESPPQLTPPQRPLLSLTPPQGALPEQPPSPGFGLPAVWSMQRQPPPILDERLPADLPPPMHPRRKPHKIKFPEKAEDLFFFDVYEAPDLVSPEPQYLSPQTPPELSPRTIAELAEISARKRLPPVEVEPPQQQLEQQEFDQFPWAPAQPGDEGMLIDEGEPLYFRSPEPGDKGMLLDEEEPFYYQSPEPLVESPGEAAGVCGSPVCPSGSPDIAPPHWSFLGDHDDAFFFDSDAPPPLVSPEDLQGPANILTVKEIDAAVTSRLADVPSENIFNAQDVGRSDLREYLRDGRGAPPVDDIGDFEIPVEVKRHPMHREFRRVGYAEPVSLGVRISPTPADYITPPRRKLPSTSKPKLSPQEEKYIEFVFGKDRETCEMVKRVSAMVIDIEQDFPDPYHIMPPTPEGAEEAVPAGAAPAAAAGAAAPQPGRTDISQLESSPEDYTLPVPTYVTVQTRYADRERSRAALGQIPTSPVRPEKQSLPKSGLRPPGSRIQPPRVGITQQAAAPAGGIPERARPSGLPQPGRTGIPQAARPGRPTGGIPKRRPQRPPDISAPTMQQPCQPCAGPTGPTLYFPPSPVDLEQQWPAIEEDFPEDVRQYQYDPHFFLDPTRKRMTSKTMLVGKTRQRRKAIPRSFQPPMSAGQIIPEEPDELPLSPRSYGVPGIEIQRRPSPIPAPSTWAPIPFPTAAARPTAATGAIPKEKKEKKSRRERRADYAPLPELTSPDRREIERGFREARLRRQAADLGVPVDQLLPLFEPIPFQGVAPPRPTAAAAPAIPQPCEPCGAETSTGVREKKVYDRALVGLQEAMDAEHLERYRQQAAELGLPQDESIQMLDAVIGDDQLANIPPLHLDVVGLDEAQAAQPLSPLPDEWLMAENLDDARFFDMDAFTSPPPLEKSPPPDFEYFPAEHPEDLYFFEETSPGGPPLELSPPCSPCEAEQQTHLQDRLQDQWRESQRIFEDAGEAFSEFERDMAPVRLRPRVLADQPPPPAVDVEGLSPISAYVAEVEARQQRFLPPPSPPLQEAPRQQYIMDEPLPERLESPLRPPVVIPGWSTPEHLRTKRKSPKLPNPLELYWLKPQHRYWELPDEDERFFERSDSPPPLAPSPPESFSPERFREPRLDEIENAWFFDDAPGASPPPLAESPPESFSPEAFREPRLDEAEHAWFFDDSEDDSPPPLAESPPHYDDIPEQPPVGGAGAIREHLTRSRDIFDRQLMQENAADFNLTPVRRSAVLQARREAARRLEMQVAAELDFDGEQAEPVCGPCAPPGPALYFGTSPAEVAPEWPELGPDYYDQLSKATYYNIARDPERRGMRSKRVRIGKTRMRSKEIPRSFKPALSSGEVIEEHPDEYQLPPRTYGVPGLEVPRRPPPIAPPRTWAPTGAIRREQPRQVRNIMDEPVPELVQDPLQPPAVVPGWRTPEHLRSGRPPRLRQMIGPMPGGPRGPIHDPNAYFFEDLPERSPPPLAVSPPTEFSPDRFRLPDIEHTADLWFFDGLPHADRSPPPLAESPPPLGESPLPTYNLPEHPDAYFFDDAHGELPDLIESPEASPSAVCDEVCPARERSITPPVRAPLELRERQKQTREWLEGIELPPALSPVAQQAAPRTPPQPAQRHILDEPIPEGLISPLHPPTMVQGWVTPEHLRGPHPARMRQTAPPMMPLPSRPQRVQPAMLVTPPPPPPEARPYRFKRPANMHDLFFFHDEVSQPPPFAESPPDLESPPHQWFRDETIEDSSFLDESREMSGIEFPPSPVQLTPPRRPMVELSPPQVQQPARRQWAPPRALPRPPCPQRSAPQRDLLDQSLTMGLQSPIRPTSSPIRRRRTPPSPPHAFDRSLPMDLPSPMRPARRQAQQYAPARMGSPLGVTPTPPRRPPMKLPPPPQHKSYELAPQVAQQAAPRTPRQPAQRHILDEPIPEGLISPLHPPTMVQGWVTPEHLRGPHPARMRQTAPPMMPLPHEILPQTLVTQTMSQRRFLMVMPPSPNISIEEDSGGDVSRTEAEEGGLNWSFMMPEDEANFQWMDK